MIFFEFLWWLVVDCFTVFAMFEAMYLLVCAICIIYHNLWRKTY